MDPSAGIEAEYHHKNNRVSVGPFFYFQNLIFPFLMCTCYFIQLGLLLVIKHIHALESAIAPGLEVRETI